MDFNKLTERSQEAVGKAQSLASRKGHQQVDIEHLLLAIAGDSGFSGKLLLESGATREKILSVLKDVRGTQRVTSQNPESTYEALEQYGRDLTRLPPPGTIDPGV